jgi:hypothetical protein
LRPRGGWFRFWNCTLDHPKVQLLPPPLFKAWVNLLALASENQDGGRLPSVRDIAFRLRVDEDEAREIVSELVSQQLLEDAHPGYRPHEWEQWQPDSDRSTERVKRHRKATKSAPAEADTERASAVSGTGDETAMKRFSNGDETAPEIEVEIEEDTPPTPPGGGIVGGAGGGAILSIPHAAPAAGKIRPNANPIPGKPPAESVARLDEMARKCLGERAETEFYLGQIEGWLYSAPADWVRDAILCTAAKARDLRAGTLAQYTAGCLRRWHPNGPPRGEVANARAKLDSGPKPGSESRPTKVFEMPPPDERLFRPQRPMKGA